MAGAAVRRDRHRFEGDSPPVLRDAGLITEEHEHQLNARGVRSHNWAVTRS